jgi:HEAT repeat protein
MDQLLTFCLTGFFFFSRACARAFERSSALILVFSALSAPVFAAAPSKDITDLRGKDAKKKHTAIRALRHDRSKAAREAAVQALTTESDARTRMALLDTIAAQGDPNQIPAIEPLLSDVSPVVRQRAALTIAMLGGPLAEDALLRHVGRESDANAKATAIRGLGVCASEKSLTALKSAASDADPAIRSAAQGVVKRLEAKKAHRASGGTPVR